MYKKRANSYLVFSVLALSAPDLLAQQPPSAGSQLQQILQVPKLQPKASEIRIEHGKQVKQASIDQTTVRVENLRITGAQAFTEAALLGIIGFKQQSVMSLADLNGLAERVSDYYHAQGYFLAQAYLPAQDVKDGLITLAVIEGSYGAITIHNESRLKDHIAINLMEPQAHKTVTIAPLERSLLLLTDLPGIQVRSMLTPGASVGSSDLVMQLDAGPLVSGSVDGDSHGNRYTGRNRLGTSLNLNNPSGYGDIASVRLLTSGEGLNYMRAAYQVQIERAKVGVAYAHLNYRLGREFESLQAHGAASIASIYASYPLMRSRQSNLSLQLAFDSKRLRDEVDTSHQRQTKKVHVLMLSLNGDHRDNFAGLAINTYSLTSTFGSIDLQDSAVRAVDAAAAKTQGSYSKLGFSVARLQSAGNLIQLYVAANGQISSKNLDVSEKMQLSGAHAVRAYPEGESSGDSGFVVSGEVRYNLPLANFVLGQVQLVGFIDTGAVILNRNPWLQSKNRRKLSGAGLGLNWSVGRNFNAKAFYAHKVGNAAATSVPDANSRFWLQAVKYF